MLSVNNLIGFGSINDLSSISIDQYFNYVTMLLQGNGTNGAQNNTFLDGSPNNFTITRNGNTTQGSFGPYGNRWSNYFDGNGDYLSAADNTSLNLTSGDFTIEAWVYWNGANSYGTVLDKDGQAGSTYTQYDISLDNNGYMRFIVGSGTATASFQTITSSVLMPKNSWVHVAGVKNGTTLTLYQNGVSVASATQTVTMGTSNKALFIGYHNGQPSSFYWDGYISNLRIVKGTAVYTAAFTPPAVPLTAITNTSLLTCQSNRFIDNSSNNFTITRNGDVSVRSFSPFLPSSAYSTSVNGGSGYFDGTGDFLSFTGITLNGDFCLEAWYYRTGTPTNGYSVIFGGSSAASDTNNNQFTVQNNGSVSIALSGTVVVTAAGTAAIMNAWNHIAFVRSGSSLAIFVNGVRQATGTSSINTSICSRIGDIAGFSGYLPIGYIASARIVVGSSVYDPSLTTLTVPTGPLTAISNTQLLLNFTNAGVVDSAADNVLETVGNAQISTSVKKYGTGSLSFDGTGDWLQAPYTPDLDLSNGDWTVEGWVRFAGTAEYSIVSINSNTSTFAQCRVQAVADGTWRLLVANSSVSGWLSTTTGGSWTTNTWYHFAAVRNGSNYNLYIDGTSVNSFSSSTSIGLPGSSVTRVGSSVGASNDLNGYVDDLRITKGVARYTANFTPPDTEFPRQ